MKRRILCLMASLLLCGAVSAQNWGDNPDSHAQPSNTPIVATVQINGNTVATPTSDYRLGAFIDGNLWGIAAPHTDNKFWIQVFYETTGEEISFKLYDGQNEYTTCTVVEPTTMTAVTTSEAGAVVTLNFTNGQTVETQLAEGWNWWSPSFEMDGEAMLVALQNALGGNGVRITSQSDGSLVYEDEEWSGRLQSIVPEKMYRIQNISPCTLSLTAAPAIPSNHPITIYKGYTWMGFPATQSMNLSEVFSSFTPEEGDRIVSFEDGSALYEDEEWSGRLTRLEPGKGYIYISVADESKTLIIGQSATNNK